jgi:hypothetical protein
MLKESFKAEAETRKVSQLAFPNGQNAPAKFSERRIRASIAFNIRLELLQPERSVALRRVCKFAAAMSVPKASVDHDDSLVPRQDEIGSAGQRCHVQPKAVTESVEN